MPKFSADGVELYYEVTGEGFSLVWSHEFGGREDAPGVRLGPGHPELPI